MLAPFFELCRATCSPSFSDPNLLCIYTLQSPAKTSSSSTRSRFKPRNQHLIRSAVRSVAAARNGIWLSANLKVMATDALTAFLLGDFPRAEAALSALAADDGEDPRIRHNTLVTRFYSRQSKEDLDDLVIFVSSHLGDSPPASPKAFFERATSDPSTLKPLYSSLGPVALYNVAVIAYVEGYVPAAASLGELLYANIEAMEDWLALKVCFLLADVHLRLSDVSSAIAVAAYAERLIPAFAKPVTTQVDQNTPPNMSSEMKVLSPDWPGREKAVLDVPTSYEDAKFCMHIYNARLSAVSDGSRNIRKEAKSAVLAADDSGSRPTSAALLVKARVEQNVAKSLRILTSVGVQSPPNIMKKVRPIALNSLGILHHRLGRHSLAACYFEHSRRAFLNLFAAEDQEDGDKEQATRTDLTVFSAAKDSHVCYNLALQHMKLGDYTRALELFSTSARVDTTFAADSALLWIRMAECCIGLELGGVQSKQNLEVEGQGKGRRFILRSEEKDEGLGMEYASTCARGALAILDRLKAQAPEAPVSLNTNRNLGMMGAVPKSEKDDSSESPPAQVVSQDVSLRSAALCLLAYSSLSFDPEAAIGACDELISLFPQDENERALLGRLYSAEALCLLGRAEEAANRLAPLLAINASHESQYKEAACINMALSHLSNDDINAASRAAKVALKVASQRRYGSLRRQASFVAAYVFIRGGETDMARQILRSLHSSAEI